MQRLKAITVVKFNKHMYQDLIISDQDDEDWLQAYHRALDGQADTDITLEDEVLWYKGRLWVRNSVYLKKMILQEEHDSTVAGHMGQETTIELEQRYIFWPQVSQRIEDYGWSCTDCQKNNAACKTHYGILQPPELSYRPWDEISMDTIVDLPVSNG